jgi:catechol 2,3-dioxygenase-like lactoylglutathione lyase family enzyme
MEALGNKSAMSDSLRKEQRSVKQSPVLELRVALTTKDYDRLVEFYCTGLGIEPAQLWTGEGDRAAILDMGRATLELFDEPHADAVDQIEVGRRVSGPIRFALQVPDVQAALERLVAHGATIVHPPITTPWGHRNVRVQDPDGLQVTLYQVLDKAL